MSQLNPASRSRLFLRRTRCLAALLCLAGSVLYAAGSQAQNVQSSSEPILAPPVTKPPAAPDRDASCRIIYLGFVGALEPAHNKSSGVVQIGNTLQGPDFPDVCARSYSPYVWTDGLHWLLKHFPSHAGPVSAEELQHSPKVVLVGHSMGGWAMISVARQLNSRNIPVELTIQIDSVGITDYTLPRNIKFAAIFHARDVLMPLTTKHIGMEDPSRTKLVEDVTVKGAGHESITRDPRIRELVMKTIENLQEAFAVAAANPSD